MSQCRLSLPVRLFATIGCVTRRHGGETIAIKEAPGRSVWCNPRPGRLDPHLATSTAFWWIAGPGRGSDRARRRRPATEVGPAGFHSRTCVRQRALLDRRDSARCQRQETLEVPKVHHPKIAQPSLSSDCVSRRTAGRISYPRGPTAVTAVRDGHSFCQIFGKVGRR